MFFFINDIMFVDVCSFLLLSSKKGNSQEKILALIKYNFSLSLEIEGNKQKEKNLLAFSSFMDRTVPDAGGHTA